MHFDQHVHAQFERARFQFRHQAMVERRHDQQDRVSTHRARFIDLVHVDHEILADHRDLACGARLLEVGDITLEKMDVGQHRQAGRAMTGIAFSDCRRPEVGPQHAARWRCLLDLRDHAGLAGSNVPAQAGAETPQVALQGGVAFNFAPQAGQVAVFFGGGDFVGLDCQDLVENVGHGERFSVVW